jgi:hypothetical protein
MLSVISSHVELYFVHALLIDHGNGPSFQGMPLMYYQVPLNCACFYRNSGCKQPSSISLILTKLNNLFNIISYDSRGRAPEWKVKYLYIFVELTQRTRPVASCSGFRGHNPKDFYRLVSSMRRTAVVALHSMGYSRLSLFSCLVVDKLLLVLLLSRCRILPMGFQFSMTILLKS